MNYLVRLASGFVCSTVLVATVRAELVCEAPTPLEATPDLEVDADPDQIQISADRGEAARDGRAVLEGNVEFRQGARRIRADSAEYNLETQELKVSGEVEFTDGEVAVRGREAEFQPERGARLSDTSFNLLTEPARGRAGKIEILPEGILRLDDVSFTTCPEDRESWLFRARAIELDTNTGIGKGKRVTLRLGPAPVFYLPKFSFPISDNRKTGILLPEVGNSERNGVEIGLPVYWNIRPNYDATFFPRYLSRRGFQLGTEFRYLLPASAGQFDGAIVPYDDQTGTARDFQHLIHQSDFTANWRIEADITNVSDDQYFEDFGRGQAQTSQTHLLRNIQANFFGDTWAWFVRVQNYQTIAPLIPSDERPYEMLPQVVADAQWLDRGGGLDYSLATELVSFDRDVGVTGARLNVVPEMSRRFGRRGYYLTPTLALQHTAYALERTAPGQNDSPTRTAPIFTFDAGTIFERISPKFIQTLEPRVLYAYVPFRDQSDLPVFDTDVPDFNMVELFRANRFVGPDRLGDTSQISVGFTTRLLDSTTGRQLLTGTLGQRFLLQDQRVTLPGEPPAEAGASNLLAELGFSMYGNWGVDFGYEWNPSDSQTERIELRFHYEPVERVLFNLGYRFRRQSVEQTDLSFAWRVASAWSLVGRFKYDWKTDSPLDRLFGVEYRSCCWALSLVGRRFVRDRAGDFDTSIGIQLELRGMTSVGTGTDELLRENIVGYSPRTETVSRP